MCYNSLSYNILHLQMVSGAEMHFKSSNKHSDSFTSDSPRNLSFWKKTYYTYHNFAIEPHQEVINTEPNWGNSFKISLSKFADLIYTMWLEVDIPAVSDSSGTFEWVSWLGHALPEQVSLDVSAEKIAETYGQFMHIDHELQSEPGKQYAYSDMLGNNIEPSQGGTLIIPINLWFTKRTYSSLPIGFMHFEDVILSLKFSPLEKLYRGGGSDLQIGDISDVRLYTERVYLDKSLQHFFRNTTLKYPVETIQSTTALLQQKKRSILLPFNNRVSELIWVVIPKKNINDNDNPNQLFNFTDKSVSDTSNLPEVASVGGETLSGNNPVEKADILLDGNSRVGNGMPGHYYSRIQPLRYHTNIPPSRGINVYSFALDPEDPHQPSGTADLNAFNSRQLVLNVSADAIRSSSGTNTNGADVYIYARTFRIMIVKKGSGGLQYYSS